MTRSTIESPNMEDEMNNTLAEIDDETKLREALAESQKRELEFSALLEASRTILEYRDFSQAARRIFDSCKNLIGATAGYVALLSEDGTENLVLFLDAGGVHAPLTPAFPCPSGDSGERLMAHPRRCMKTISRPARG